MTRPVPLNVIAAYLSQRASVGAVAVAPSNTVAPVVSGTATEGQTLSCTTGTWTGDTPIVYTYQWQHGTTNISGATSSTYVISASYVGETIRCRVTATNAAGAATANSNATSPVSAVAPVNTVAPVVSGTAQQGQTLSTTDGTWTGTSPTFTYQWQRAGVNIGSATASTYVLVSADYGSAIRCVVTATNAAGSASANSNATSAVTRTYAQEVIADSPAGYWKFNEGSGTSFTDYSGNSLTLGSHGSPTLSNSGPGTGETCATLVSSSSQYFDHADANSLDLGDVFTIEIWYKRSATQGTFQYLLSKGSNAYAMYMDTGNFAWCQRRAILDLFRTSSQITSTTTWQHIVAVKNGATHAMYLNGSSNIQDAGNSTCADNTTLLTIGCRDDLSSFLDGSIAHVAIYPTALSSGRVAAHYAAMT